MATFCMIKLEFPVFLVDIPLVTQKLLKTSLLDRMNSMLDGIHLKILCEIRHFSAVVFSILNQQSQVFLTLC